MSLEHILLGMLSERAASGYDLKREFSESARHFWHAELSQIYPTLKGLEREGCLKSESAPSQRGPRRRVYRITRSGRSKLDAWLRSEPDVSQGRIAYVAQIFFLDALGDLSMTRVQVERLRDAWTARLAVLESMERRACSMEEAGDSDFHKLAALRAGIHQLRAKRGWCDETLAHIDRRLKKKGVGHGRAS